MNNGMLYFSDFIKLLCRCSEKNSRIKQKTLAFVVLERYKVA